jgi:hypothetical protein
MASFSFPRLLQLMACRFHGMHGMVHIPGTLPSSGHSNLLLAPNHGSSGVDCSPVLFLHPSPNVPPPKPKISNYSSLSVHGSPTQNGFFRNGHTAIPPPVTGSTTTPTISMECTFPTDAAASGASSLVPMWRTLSLPYPPIVFPWRNFLRPLRSWPSVVSRLAEPPPSHPYCRLHLRIIFISSRVGTNDYCRMSPSWMKLHSSNTFFQLKHSS